MTPIDRIMALEMTDLSDAVGQSGSLAYTDVPLTADGDLVLIESAAIVSSSNIEFIGPLQTAFGYDSVETLTGRPASSATSAGSFAPITAPSTSNAATSSGAFATSIPEPSALLLALIGTAAMTRRR